jgi:hypothetical protein
LKPEEIEQLLKHDMRIWQAALVRGKAILRARKRQQRDEKRMNEG